MFEFLMNADHFPKLLQVFVVRSCAPPLCLLQVSQVVSPGDAAGVEAQVLVFCLPC